MDVSRGGGCAASRGRFCLTRHQHTWPTRAMPKYQATDHVTGVTGETPPAVRVRTRRAAASRAASRTAASSASIPKAIGSPRRCAGRPRRQYAERDHLAPAVERRRPAAGGGGCLGDLVLLVDALQRPRLTDASCHAHRGRRRCNLRHGLNRSWRVGSWCCCSLATAGPRRHLRLARRLRRAPLHQQRGRACRPSSGERPCLDRGSAAHRRGRGRSAPRRNRAPAVADAAAALRHRPSPTRSAGAPAYRRPDVRAAMRCAAAAAAVAPHRAASRSSDRWRSRCALDRCGGLPGFYGGVAVVLSRSSPRASTAAARATRRCACCCRISSRSIAKGPSPTSAGISPARPGARAVPAARPAAADAAVRPRALPLSRRVLVMHARRRRRAHASDAARAGTRARCWSSTCRRAIAATPSSTTAWCAACARLIDAAAMLGVPVLATEQYPKGLGHTQPEVAEGLPPQTPMHREDVDELLRPAGFVARADARSRAPRSSSAASRRTPASTRPCTICWSAAIRCTCPSTPSRRVREPDLQAGWEKMIGSGAVPSTRRDGLSRMGAHRRGAAVQGHPQA